MTPQLFINYRLKSVAHLPWKFFMCALCTRPSCWLPSTPPHRVLICPSVTPRHTPTRPRYKALNTFIDDLFAFIIKMPTLHRMSCFRDDIVFMVFLYQRWVYRVDKSRMNEFGQRYDDEGNDDKESKKGK